MLDNIEAYLALEQNNSWLEHQRDVLGLRGDLFVMMVAWRNRDMRMLEAGQAMSMAATNVAIFRMYQHAMGGRLMEERMRYGGMA